MGKGKDQTENGNRRGVKKMGRPEDVKTRGRGKKKTARKGEKMSTREKRARI